MIKQPSHKILISSQLHYKKRFYYFLCFQQHAPAIPWNTYVLVISSGITVNTQYNLLIMHVSYNEKFKYSCQNEDRVLIEKRKELKSGHEIGY